MGSNHLRDDADSKPCGEGYISGNKECRKGQKSQQQAPSSGKKRKGGGASIGGAVVAGAAIAAGAVVASRVAKNNKKPISKVVPPQVAKVAQEIQKAIDDPVAKKKRQNETRRQAIGYAIAFSIGAASYAGQYYQAKNAQNQAKYGSYAGADANSAKEFEKELYTNSEMRKRYMDAVRGAKTTDIPYIKNAFYKTWKAEKEAQAGVRGKKKGGTKTQQGRDYWDVIGVSKGASLEEIKGAYRKAAMRYHPDRNPGDKAAEERFKEIAEAWEIARAEKEPKQQKKDSLLSDPIRLAKAILRREIAIEYPSIRDVLAVGEDTSGDIIGVFRNTRSQLLDFRLNEEGELIYGLRSERSDAGRDNCKRGVQCNTACIQAGDQCRKSGTPRLKRAYGRVKELIKQGNEREQRAREFIKKKTGYEVQSRAKLAGEGAVAVAGIVGGVINPVVAVGASVTTRAIVETGSKIHSAKTAKLRRDLVEEIEEETIKELSGGIVGETVSAAVTATLSHSIPGIGAPAAMAVQGRITKEILKRTRRQKGEESNT